MQEQLAARYQRNYKTISLTDQSKLRQATVAIVGCGGLGGFMAEEFARLGVGSLILIDGDNVEESNLNRQLFATEQTLGKPKVEAAGERLQVVNPNVKVKLIRDWFSQESAATILQGADLVCDALDNINLRVVLEQCCHQLGMPLVYAGIAGWFGMLGVSYPGDNIVANLFGHGQPGAEKEWGNPVFTPAVVATLSVVEATKILTGRDSSLRHAWLQVDLLTMEFERFALS